MGVPINMSLVLTGVDATGRAFASAGAGASRLAGKMSAAFSKVAAALPAILGGAAVKKSLDDLNLLNDAAQRAGVSARWLKQFGGAMAQFGVQMQQADIVGSVQKLNAGLVNTEKIVALQKLGIDVKALQGMKPETAFVKFLETVAAIPDEQTRLLALMRGMEEQGLKMAPILREGPDAFRAALSDVMAMIPAASDATVTLATNANNALSLAGDTFKTAWYDALGSVLEWAETTFGGVDNAILTVVEQVRYRIDQTVTFWTVAAKNALIAAQNLGRGAAAVLREPGLILEWIQHQARKLVAVFTAIRDWVKSKFGDGESMTAMDAFGQGLVAVEAENAAWAERLKSTGVVMKEYVSLGKEVQKVEAAHIKRTRLNEAGLAAKKKLNVNVAETFPKEVSEKLSGNVADAVGAGVKQGLSKGVEYGSYDVVKSMFRNGAAGALQGVRAKNAVDAVAAPSAVNRTSGAVGGVAGDGSAVGLLRDILKEIRKSNAHFAQLGAF